MKLVDLELLRKLIHGATVTEKDGLYQFSRFTEEQSNVYSGNRDFLQKSTSTSSVRMEFETDASSVTLDIVAAPGSSRNFYYFDIMVNDVLVQYSGAESCLDQPEFRLEIPLDGKKNRVCIYFPNLVKISLKQTVFTGASVIEPIRKKFRIVSYGDSITQGYDAYHPSLAYANQLADALDAELWNKGIGGEIFNPALAAVCEPQKPDLITVAYGTNDWVRCTSKDQMIYNAEHFFKNLVTNNPDVPVVAILPIWRNDFNQTTAVGSFEEAREIVRNICSKYQEIQIVDGIKLVPHLDECYRSDGLHPNDFGFQFMGRNLLKYLPEF